jgi:hypothetical protein
LERRTEDVEIRSEGKGWEKRRGYWEGREDGKNIV